MNKRTDNKVFDWMLRYYLIIALFMVPIISMILNMSVFFLGYFFLVAFTLPSLIAKVIFKENFFSLTTAYSFLIYPGVYAIGLILRSIGVDLGTYYEIAGIGLIIVWIILVISLVFNAKFNDNRQNYKQVLFSAIPFLIFMPIVFVTRDFGSIISTDILVHKTVLNGMADPQVIGFMPGDYSSTFTDQAYPIVMFHTFLFMLANAFKFDYALVGYFVDIFLTLIFSLATYKLFRKYYKPGWAVLGAVLTLLVFENLAYTAHFFIPQTFAFLLFMFILGDKDLKLKGLIAAFAILLLTHFFIGIFLSFFLILKYVYYERIIDVENKKQNLIFFQEISLGLIFIILLSSRGFSIEEYFQGGIVNWVGAMSNPDFEGKLKAMFALLGAGWLIIIPVFLRVLSKPRKTMPELIGFFGLMTNIGVYFLAPVFAGKFLLGFGLFSSLLVISCLEKLKPKMAGLYVIIGGLLIISYGVNYALQFETLSSFLRQENGQTTAIVEKDKNLVKYWQENTPECVLISDPQTQLTIHSLGEGESMRGNYMNLEDRRALAQFIETPDANTFKEVKNLGDLSDPRYEGKPLCIGISARLTELVAKGHPWTRMIFIYQVDHTGLLNKQIEVMNFLDKNSRGIYIDDYHAVYLLE